MKPVVLVHGAWHGPWCWEFVTPLLDAAGVPWVAPDLPSCARAQEGAGFSEDAQTVEAALDALPGNEPAVLLGHSGHGFDVAFFGAFGQSAHGHRIEHALAQGCHEVSPAKLGNIPQPEDLSSTLPHASHSPTKTRWRCVVHLPPRQRFSST